MRPGPHPPPLFLQTLKTQTWSSSSSSSSRGSSGGGSADATSDVGDQVLDGHSLQSFGKEACRQNASSLYSASLPVITLISITTHHHFTHYHYPSSIYSASLHITLLSITTHHHFTQHHYPSSLYSASVYILTLLSLTTHPHFTQNHCTSSLYSESLHIIALLCITAHHHFTRRHFTHHFTWSDERQKGCRNTLAWLPRRHAQKHLSESSPKSMSLSLSGEAKHPGKSRPNHTRLSGYVPWPVETRLACQVKCLGA